ncbi:MAG: hypothetical protein GX361_00395 [Bacteroidales bacterium]|nr:hypothetical protein [Bacteroidales bacterium]
MRASLTALIWVGSNLLTFLLICKKSIPALSVSLEENLVANSIPGAGRRAFARRLIPNWAGSLCLDKSLYAEYPCAESEKLSSKQMRTMKNSFLFMPESYFL